MANALTDFFGEIITDIRHKLVEEGWFGRALTAEDPAPERPAAGTGWLDWQAAEPGSQDIAGPDLGQGHDLDR